MVVDQTKNLSYIYLREHNNDWVYNAAYTHPKLVARLMKRFDTFDLDSDGDMFMEEVLTWADRMKKMVNADKDQVENMRKAIRLLFSGCGVPFEGSEEGLKREDWVECNQAFAEAERVRILLGETPIHATLSDAYLDVLDIDGDGLVCLRELKQMMRAFEVPQEAAYTFFAHADVDQSGTLERHEMHALFRKFWLEEYNPELDMIYAGKY